MAAKVVVVVVVALVAVEGENSNRWRRPEEHTLNEDRIGKNGFFRLFGACNGLDQVVKDDVQDNGEEDWEEVDDVVATMKKLLLSTLRLSFEREWNVDDAVLGGRR